MADALMTYGFPGPKGDTGASGAQGPVGPAGPRGPAGPDSTVFIYRSQVIATLDSVQTYTTGAINPILSFLSYGNSLYALENSTFYMNGLRQFTISNITTRMHSNGIHDILNSFDYQSSGNGSKTLKLIFVCIV